MGAMACQITILTSVYPAVYSGAENIKDQRHWPLCRETPVTGEFSAQRPVTGEMLPFDDVMI